MVLLRTLVAICVLENFEYLFYGLQISVNPSSDFRLRVCLVLIRFLISRLSLSDFWQPLPSASDLDFLKFDSSRFSKFPLWFGFAKIRLVTIFATSILISVISTALFWNTQQNLVLLCGKISWKSFLLSSIGAILALRFLVSTIGGFLFVLIVAILVFFNSTIGGLAFFWTPVTTVSDSVDSPCGTQLGTQFFDNET